MKKLVNGINLTILLAGAYALIPAQVSNQAHWPQWRGRSLTAWRAEMPRRIGATPATSNGKRLFPGKVTRRRLFGVIGYF